MDSMIRRSFFVSLRQLFLAQVILSVFFVGSVMAASMPQANLYDSGEMFWKCEPDRGSGRIHVAIVKESLSRVFAVVNHKSKDGAVEKIERIPVTEAMSGKIIKYVQNIGSDSLETKNFQLMIFVFSTNGPRPTADGIIWMKPGPLGAQAGDVKEQLYCEDYSTP